MSRRADVPKILAAWLLALAIGLAPTLAAAVHPSFTSFNAPDTSLITDLCKTDAVLGRIGELRDAVNQLDRKIGRIGRAKDKAQTELLEARGPARRGALIRELTDLRHWQERWKTYQGRLRSQIQYYEALPHCGDTDSGFPLLWPGSVELPTAIGDPTPINTKGMCLRPPGTRLLQLSAGEEADKANRSAADGLKAERASLAAALDNLADLVAKRKGRSDAAEALRKEIDARLDLIFQFEDWILRNNAEIRRVQKEAACPPPASTTPPSISPPPERPPSQAAVPLGAFETNVLAVLNRARADPGAYADTLRGARGRWAGEARDFLRARSPLLALVADPALTAAALSHAQDLARRDTVGHTGADGSGVLARFHAQGHFVTLAAEVIAIRQATPEAVIRQLVIDEGHPGGPHRKDLFNPVFTRVGVALATTRSHGRICVITLSNEPMRPES